jgi:hypothetical protein
VEIHSFVQDDPRTVQFRADLAGLLVVSMAASYEACVKETLMNFAANHHAKFGNFAQNHFARLNSRIALADLYGYPFDDLAALNVGLARLPLLDVPEPASVDFNAITMDLSLRLDADDDAVRHAFHIRNATGRWRPLATSVHKRILAELLLSKFLHPLHETRRLWPLEQDTA